MYNYERTLIEKEFYNKIHKIPLLTEKEEQMFLEKMIEKDSYARYKILYHNLRLILPIARKYARASTRDFSDIFQDGFLGLMVATENFDLSKRKRFSTYATYWIYQKIQYGEYQNNQPIKNL